MILKCKGNIKDTKQFIAFELRSRNLPHISAFLEQISTFQNNF
jgi:hypothetical protein